MNEKTLVLVFKKSTGSTYSFSIPYPKENLEPAKVKAFGESIVSTNILSFKDGSTLAKLENAYVKEMNKSTIAIA